MHHYSEEDRRFYMSYIAAFSCFVPADVQGCHDIVQNILEYGFTTRQTVIRDALAQLYPFPEHWETSRPASAMDSTPVDSSGAEDASSNKSPRRER